MHRYYRGESEAGWNEEMDITCRIPRCSHIQQIFIKSLLCAGHSLMDPAECSGLAIQDEGIFTV